MMLTFLAFAKAGREEIPCFMPKRGTEALKWQIEIEKRPIVEAKFPVQRDTDNQKQKKSQLLQELQNRSQANVWL